MDSVYGVWDCFALLRRARNDLSFYLVLLLCQNESDNELSHCERSEAIPLSFMNSCSQQPSQPIHQYPPHECRYQVQYQ